MADFRNHLLIEHQDLLQAAEHVRQAFADIGVRMVSPETVGAHHATLHVLGERQLTLEFEDDWRPFGRPLTESLSRHTRSAVASCYLHGRGEVEQVELFDAGKPLASYLISDGRGVWEVAKAGEDTVRLQLPPNDEDDWDQEEENFETWRAACRKAQAETFKSLPFSSLLGSARWHDVWAEKTAPRVALSFVDEQEDLTAAKGFEESIEASVGSLLSELGFRRTKASSHGYIAFVRPCPERQLYVELGGRYGWDSTNIKVVFEWLAPREQGAEPARTYKQFSLADGVSAAELSAAFLRRSRALGRFAPELLEDLARVGRLHKEARVSRKAGPN